MSTCILCTRCVRACEDIQVVGVLDVANRGDHAKIIVGADGNPEHAGCVVRRMRPCRPTGAIHDILPMAVRAANGVSTSRMRSKDMPEPDRTVRSVCPYCGVGCQIDSQVRDDTVVHVRSPWIEENTPNNGSTCVKGRFGTDFIQHRDRLLKPLIRRGWSKRDGRWEFDPAPHAAAGWGRRGGPWDLVQGEANEAKRRPKSNPLNTSPTGMGSLGDPRDRVATPASWYEPFREATWEEAMELAAQELVRLRETRGPKSLAVFQSASAATRELLQRMFRRHRLTTSTTAAPLPFSSVAAMQRSITPHPAPCARWRPNRTSSSSSAPIPRSRTRLRRGHQARGEAWRDLIVADLRRSSCPRAPFTSRPSSAPTSPCSTPCWPISWRRA